MYIHCRYVMNTTIQMWGNSLALRIRSARRRYRLAQLVRKITPANRHTETAWGKSVGKEL